MTTIAPSRPAELPGLPVRLTAGPAAVAEACRQVRAALDLWHAPVDPDIAVRVDVHGSAIASDLILVRTLSDEWGCYPTPAGQAVYFTLAFQHDGRDA
jgi:hypothetical protein